LKTGGYLNEEFPGGAESHKALLTKERFKVAIGARVINRTAVVRDPYARRCGRGEAVGFLPIPIGPKKILDRFAHGGYT